MSIALNYFPVPLLTLVFQKTARIQACLGCQQAQAKCHIGSLRSIAEMDEGPEEGLSRRTRDVGREGGAGIGPLLEGIRSALKEQTWLMWQMWVTHTAMESELRLLRHLAEYTFNRVFWVPYDEWRGERGSGQGEAQGKGRSMELQRRGRGGAWSSRAGEGEKRRAPEKGKGRRLWSSRV